MDIPGNHLIANKRIVNRPKDQIDVIELEKIRKIREQGKNGRVLRTGYKTQRCLSSKLDPAPHLKICKFDTWHKARRKNFFDPFPNSPANSAR
jgi:hypothetical protein